MASNGYRLLAPPDGTPAPDQQVRELATRGAEQVPGRTVRVAFRDYGPRDAPVVVLLHGSPVASSTFDRLGPRLAGEFRLIVPDLPGFGGSSLRVPDYAACVATA